MDMPTEDTPGEAYLPRSAYCIARVAADPKTAGLEKELSDAHAALKQAVRAREDAEEEVEKKSAILDIRDEHCDDDIDGFELHLLGAVKKDRDNPKYRRYFKNGLREVTTAEPRKEEPGLVGEMLDAMAKDGADPEIGAAVAFWQPKLAASREAVVTADKELTAAENQYVVLKEKTLPALMAAWREAYKKLAGALTMVYPTDPKRVDRFFKPFRKRRKAEKKANPAP